MKQILTVFSYTFKEGIHKKAFWISTGIIVAMILLACLVPRIFLSSEGKADSEDVGHEKKGICYLIDEAGIFAENIEQFEVRYPELRFEISGVQNLEELKVNIREHEQNSLIYIKNTDKQPVLHVVNANFMKGISAKNVAEVCDKIMQAQYFQKLGVGKEEIAAIQTPMVYTEEYAGDMEPLGYVLGIIMTLVMFFAVYYYGNGVAMSVAAEKTSRVMETLIVSAKPSRILAGKCLGMGAVGLLQLGGLLVFGIFCYETLFPKEIKIQGMEFSLTGISGSVVLLLLLYFILGYALYAVLNSVCGAAVSRIEDLNSALLPVSILVIVGFYLGYFTSIAGGGSSALAALAMYLPISSPFAVPFKLLSGGIEPGQIGLSIAFLMGSIVLVAFVSARIYSVSVMHYGSTVKWKDIKKMK